MADFASQIYGTAQNVAQNQGAGLAEAVQQGVGLAQRQEQIQMQRQELDLKKTELKTAKYDKLIAALDNVTKYKTPKAKNGYLKSLEGYANQLGLTDMVTPEVFQSLQSDENLGRKVTLRNKLASGEINQEQYFAILKDQTLMVKVPVTPEEFWGDDTAKTLDVANVVDNLAKNEAAKQRASEKGGGTQGRFDANMVKDLSVKFDAKVAKQKDRLTAANNIITLLEQKNPISDSAVRTQLARLSGEVGALSDFDVKTWSGDPAMLQQAQQYLNRAATGKLTESNREQMKQTATIMQQVVKNRIKAEADRTVSLAKSPKINIDEVTMRSALDVESLTETPAVGQLDWKKTLANAKAAATKLPKAEFEKFVKGFAAKYGADEKEVLRMLGGK